LHEFLSINITSILQVREAGGDIFDFKGGDQSISRREIIATNGHISEELVDIIKLYFN
jgi:myo-inositol-1(or 4)-monophosphatase